jgi:hypothetical protein
MTDKFVIAKIEREHKFLLSELDRFIALIPNPRYTDELGCNCTPEAAVVYQNQLDDFSVTFISCLSGLLPIMLSGESTHRCRVSRR